MSREEKAKAIKVVLAPDILARCFFDLLCKKVLERWRNGEIYPVVTRSLAERYIRVLKGLGLSGSVIRRWIMWFTSPERADYVNQTTPAASGAFEQCMDAATSGGAKVIISASGDWWKKKDAESEIREIEWKTAPDFLQGRNGV